MSKLTYRNSQGELVDMAAVAAALAFSGLSIAQAKKVYISVDMD